ncbi:hypothetical protein CVU76_00335 [Candidatus Dojkabacteria bacterium HGW-Dojkabacteria-1]|uniref:Uncharacterized protein n=1 Tax=Candidatus Dojkabacteria bacterium HGW-Dojkabacteria-1 TaxID=2013761 RepID=A0A2N2F2V9_9BACT|nr:MAG: hypothetical protein CVU76_00335 [Candidatus Dojkabacteria bacterium HGW-Dojkabacteria-1]
MEVVKKYIVGIVLLLVIVIIWLGLLFLSDTIFSTVNPKADSYVKPINKEFDMEMLEKVSERTESSFPVTPSEFFDLTNED